MKEIKRVPVFLKHSVQFRYLNSFDCQISTVYRNIGTFASQNYWYVNQINLHMGVNFFNK